MRKYKCFFCIYPNIEGLQHNDRLPALALNKVECSVIRIIEAESRENAIEKFVEMHIDDSDEYRRLIYPQCIEC